MGKKTPIVEHRRPPKGFATTEAAQGACAPKSDKIYKHIKKGDGLTHNPFKKLKGILHEDR